MKTLIVLAVAAATLAAGAVPATAQHRVVTRTVIHHRGPVVHSRRVCRTEYRHHHRVRVCRTVRR